MRPKALQVLRHEERPVDPAQVRRLYESATWGRARDDQGVGLAINASLAVGAWDGDRLVGFARALSDGRYRAYVEDVIVDPGYRQFRVGTKLVAALLDALGDIEIVSLFCAPERVDFYRRNGFVAQPAQVMMHRERTDVP
jgi:GNAT superfamily N-acetyltransferase